MAEIRKPGRPKKYTAASFQRACEAYFDSISYQKPVMRGEMEFDADGYPVLDDFGHPKIKYKPVITTSGKEATETVWTEPPSLTGLCLYLGIDRATFSRYGTHDDEKPEESERFCNTVTRARGRVEAYLESRLEDKSASRGAIFNLQQNFGWKEKKEIDLGAGAQKAMAAASMSMDEKLALLKEIGAEVPE